MNNQPPIINFGPHKGKTVGEVSSNYLSLLASTVDGELAQAAQMEYDWRTKENTHWWDDEGERK